MGGKPGDGCVDFCGNSWSLLVFVSVFTCELINYYLLLFITIFFVIVVIITILFSIQPTPNLSNVTCEDDSGKENSNSDNNRHHPVLIPKPWKLEPRLLPSHVLS